MSTLTLNITREVEPKEVEDIVTGTGALTWSWWGEVRAEQRDDVSGYKFQHDRDVDPEGTMRGLTWVSEQQIVDAAGEFLRKYEGEDAKDARDESLGYLDAVAADSVLQIAVFGKVVYG